MDAPQPLLLIAAVAAVGVLHTLVPDHWVPIVVLARQHGWPRADTARAALRAGIGHVVSTLVIALVVWSAGSVVAERFGRFADMAASLALIGFGGWIAWSAWRQASHVHGHGGGVHGHGPRHTHGHAEATISAPAAIAHTHLHRHGDGSIHVHWHEHRAADAHDLPDGKAIGALHDHSHKVAGRSALLVILGSSPMVEGIPVFFAAGRYGVSLIALMMIVFAVATVATYIVLCVYASAGLQRLRFGSVERYGEVLSGGVIAALGLVLLIMAAS